MKHLKLIGWFVGVLALALLVWRVLLPLGFMWSLGAFDSSHRVPHPTLEETRTIAADVGLTLPASARVLDAFQEGGRDHTFYVRLFVPAGDLAAFTEQKLLAGKWQDGKGFTNLPKPVQERWVGYLGGDSGGWRCWNGLVPYVKNPGETWVLDLAVSPPAGGEVTVYLKLAQT